MYDEHVLYTKLAKYYDILYRDYIERVVPRYVDFAEQIFKSRAERRVERILDIACGTGAPALELARRGYSVVCLDLHEEMLEIAGSKAESEGLDIEFVRMDARSLVYDGEFDAVTMFFTSIAYMVSDSDLDRLLVGVYRALRPGGVFIADTPNPYASAYRYGAQPGPSVWEVRAPDGRLLFVIDYREFEDVRAIVHFKRLVMVVDPDGSTRSYFVYDKLRLYNARELKEASLRSGFRVAEIYGDADINRREPPNANRLFLVAVK